VLGVVGLAACVVLAGTTLVLKKLADDFLGPAQWSDDALAVADLPRVFGVRTPSAPSAFRSRVGGFQDPIYEAVVKLGPGEKDAFLAMNALALQPTLKADLVGELSSAEAEVRARTPCAGPVSATALDGFVDVGGDDGGAVELFRSGALLECDGATWVYLVAFGT